MLRRIARHPFLVAGFLLALALTLFFALRLGMGALMWTAEPDAAIEGWMPVGYVARSWDVPRDVLAEAIGIPPGSAPRQSLARIAEERGESLEELIARISAAIAAHREGADG
jgi:hypothetical protein